MFLSLSTVFSVAQSTKTYDVKSPDGKIALTVNVGQEISWQVNHEDTKVIVPSTISLALSTGEILGKNVKVSKSFTRLINTSFETHVYKKSKIIDHYNQLTLQFSGNFSIEFRAYDDGVAYRFLTDKKGEILIQNEEANFNFAGDYKAFIPYINDNRGGERYSFSFESFYDESKLSEMFTDSLSIVPLLVDLGNGKKAVILESDVENYPGMFLKINPDTRTGLKAEFAPYMLQGVTRGINFIAAQRADYIAKTPGRRSYPWRAVVISAKDTDLANNDMVQKLASPSRIADVSWIKPGKAAWDWWNNANLINVDFKAGMNTPTFKFFIDFAAANHLEYVLIDAGWSRGSLMQVNPAINLEELIAYGNKKNVGIILWSGWSGTDKEKDTVFPHYAAMGIKGFKVDFFDNDDQVMMKSVYEIARVAANNKLLLDLHGMKPSGIQRTYPNVVNFEGVKGAENFRWAAFVNGKIKEDAPRYDVTIPFTRMLSGPVDYTPGSMNNGTRTTFRTVEAAPMSQGTRSHQMAMYTVFEAPLQMLADSPSAYLKEQECTDFIAKVPAAFDETVILDGEVGEFIITARKKGDVWFVGAMTNWTGREKTIDFSFLGQGQFEAEIFSDGINSNTNANDYKKEIISVSAKDRKEIKLYQGGGWTARIYPKR
ncbi:retaining alpha-galactosidase [Bacteroidia bacterium]|nr:retaining alpha-galactosidase [Bacteroidia bacterium]GHT26218.1 retaining alpha-galactosidase [Bacteroidia bacterium]